jgi:hypothetical protein
VVEAVVEGEWHVELQFQQRVKGLLEVEGKEKEEEVLE